MTCNYPPDICQCAHHRDARMIVDTLLSERPDLDTIDDVLAYIARKLGEK